MKIAIAQITTDPGRVNENCRKIITNINLARDRGADLIVFPELALPGYGIMDLAFNHAYLDACEEKLKEIVGASKGIAVILGIIDRDKSGSRSGSRPLLYNSAAIIDDGKIIAIQDKSLLPDYDIFFEDRYFEEARTRQVINIRGVPVGVQICEDLWDSNYPIKVSDQLVSKGAKLIINISASPFHIQKLKIRSELVKNVVSKHKVGFIYTNLVGSFDGFDGEIVFDGQSLVYNSQGNLIFQASAFKEELSTIDIDSKEYLELTTSEEIEQLYNALIFGIREYFRRLNFKRAYIGLSGGIDSAVVACLAVAALGKGNVIGVTMPSEITSRETLSDAQLLAKNLAITCHSRSIKNEYSAWEADFIRYNKTDPQPLTKQNKQARIRGAILMEYTNEDRASLVLSTGNKTELALGYCTLYGDMCGGLAVIADVSKTRVYELAKYINKTSQAELIPSSIISRIPTAELEVGQTDRDNLPADYPILSPLVDKIVEDGLGLEELSKSYDPKVVHQTIKLIAINEFKRRQAAPGIKVTKRAFGIGRRIPMGHDFFI